MSEGEIKIPPLENQSSDDDTSSGDAVPNLDFTKINKEQIVEMWKKDVKRIKKEKDGAIKSNIESMDIIKKLIYKPKEETEVDKKSCVKFEVHSKPSYFDDIKDKSNVGILQKQYKLDSTVPTYSGEMNENLQQWITVITNNISLLNIPEEKQLLVITNHVKGSALQLYLNYLNDNSFDNKSLEGFLAILYKSQNFANRKASIKTKLLNLRHTLDFEGF